MQANYGATVSLWMQAEEVQTYPALRDNLEADICVVGAGLAGLACAYELLLRGRSVTVLEAGVIGNGETSRTTAHLSFALDDRYYELERLFGERGARLARESHAAAVDRIEEVVDLEQIDCEFIRLDGYLFAPPAGSKDALERELPAAPDVRYTRLTALRYKALIPDRACASRGKDSSTRSDSWTD